MAIKKTKVNKGFSPKGQGGLFGGGQTRPREDSVTGTSNSHIEILGAISEGEIVGVKDGEKGVYIDNTPLMNADGSLNFQGVTYVSVNGTQNQPRLPGFADSVNSETQIGTEVKFNLPVTRQIVNKNVDSLIVRLGFLLQEFPSDGGVTGSSVHFKIYVKEGTGPYVERISEIKSGRYSALTEFEYKLPVNNANGTIDRFFIKVERVTATDTDLNKFQRQVVFQSYIESIDTKLNYPNTAVVGIRLQAAQFSSAPSFSFLTQGKKIQIPINATVNPANGSLIYSNVPWNGVFYTPNDYCCDPAWILWDLLTSTRYGLGKQIKAKHLDRYSFLAISKYCNEYVPDGLGGVEPRFLVNVVIEGKQDAFRVIEALRSVFRGYSYFVNGALSFVSDKPTPPTMQFTQADVEEGMFSYSRTGLKARHTIAHVTWIDKDDKYKRAVETVEDAEAIQQFGVRPIEISAFGCTSRGQARRLGLATLITEKLEQETVTFKARAYAVDCTPGTVIRIADSKRSDVRYGGLLVDGNASQVTLDQPVRIEAGKTYTIFCMLVDGTIQERIITNSPGDHTVITVNITFSVMPAIEANWLISTTDIQPQLFRVLNRTAVPGTEDTVYEIMALQYEPLKYNAIEYGWKLPPPQIRQTIPTVTNLPRNLTVNFQIIGKGILKTFVLTAVWQFPLNGTTKDQFIASYLVEYKIGENGDWQGTTSTNNLFIEYPGLARGAYTVRVAAVDLYGSSSKWVESTPITLGVINASANATIEDTTFFITTDL